MPLKPTTFRVMGEDQVWVEKTVEAAVRLISKRCTRCGVDLCMTPAMLAQVAR